jgi:hypothetical protein
MLANLFVSQATSDNSIYLTNLLAKPNALKGQSYETNVASVKLNRYIGRRGEQLT